MTWVTWRQFRYQGALAAALLAALAVALLISELHAAQVWHSALAGCAKDNSCASLSLSNSAFTALVAATSAVPLLAGLFWGAPMVAHELETGTNQLAWTQSITRRRWLAIRAGWLLLAAAVLAGAVSALVTWWLGPDHAAAADAFKTLRFDITDIAPAGYAIFAMALGICAGALLRRTLPALAVTLAGFVGIRELLALWLRLHYMTPVTVYYKLTAPFKPAGSYLSVSQGIVGPNGKSPGGLTDYYVDGLQVPAGGQNCMTRTSFNGAASSGGDLAAQLRCLAGHGYRGYLGYQPASRFWAFQGIETGIFVILAAALLGVTFWVLKRRDA
jgi:hypothetical protein